MTYIFSYADVAFYAKGGFCVIVENDKEWLDG